MALESPSPRREFLVRSCGILIHDDAVLAEEEETGEDRFYALPGGHLEFGETLALCLSREFYEETGLNVEADKLVYVHENFFEHKGVSIHELGFYFLVDLSSDFPTPDADGYVPSREPNLPKRLLPLANLRAYELRPRVLIDLLPTDARESFSHPTRHLVTREE